MLRWSGLMTSKDFIASVDIDYLPPRMKHIEPWSGSGFLIKGNVIIDIKYITNCGGIIVIQINTHKSAFSDIKIFSFVGYGKFALI